MPSHMGLDTDHIRIRRRYITDTLRALTIYVKHLDPPFNLRKLGHNTAAYIITLP